MIHINQGIPDRKMFGTPNQRNLSKPGYITFDMNKLPGSLVYHKITVVTLRGVSRSLLLTLGVKLGCSLSPHLFRALNLTPIFWGDGDSAVQAGVKGECLLPPSLSLCKSAAWLIFHLLYCTQWSPYLHLKHNFLCHQLLLALRCFLKIINNASH